MTIANVHKHSRKCKEQHVYLWDPNKWAIVAMNLFAVWDVNGWTYCSSNEESQPIVTTFEGVGPFQKDNSNGYAFLIVKRWPGIVFGSGWPDNAAMPKQVQSKAVELETAYRGRQTIEYINNS